MLSLMILITCTGLTCPPTIHFKLITKCDKWYYKVLWSVTTKCDKCYCKVRQNSVAICSCYGVCKSFIVNSFLSK